MRQVFLLPQINNIALLTTSPAKNPVANRANDHCNLKKSSPQPAKKRAIVIIRGRISSLVRRCLTI